MAEHRDEHLPLLLIFHSKTSRYCLILCRSPTALFNDCLPAISAHGDFLILSGSLVTLNTAEILPPQCGLMLFEIGKDIKQAAYLPYSWRYG